VTVDSKFKILEGIVKCRRSSAITADNGAEGVKNSVCFRKNLVV
jgi:hypothetical protein